MVSVLCSRFRFYMQSTSHIHTTYTLSSETLQLYELVVSQPSQRRRSFQRSPPLHAPEGVRRSFHQSLPGWFEGRMLVQVWPSDWTDRWWWHCCRQQPWLQAGQTTLGGTKYGCIIVRARARACVCVCVCVCVYMCPYIQMYKHINNTILLSCCMFYHRFLQM